MEKINREQQRLNRKRKRIQAAIEKKLERKNMYGINDPTPYKAINNIIYNRNIKDHII